MGNGIFPTLLRHPHKVDDGPATPTTCTNTAYIVVVRFWTGGCVAMKFVARNKILFNYFLVNFIDIYIFV